jgi:drug/metabolite transporter (DMT)-like permease
VLALLFNAFTWGLSWWPLRAMHDAGLHPLWATALIYALIALLLVSIRPARLRDVLRHRGLWVLGLASGLTNATFNWGVATGDVVRVVLLFYLMPLWNLLLARWLLKEPLHAGVLLRAALAVAGALIVLSPTDGGWPWPRDAADWLGLAGGIAFALNNVMLRREAGRDATARALAMFCGGTVIGGATALAAGAIGVSPPASGTSGWLPLVLVMVAWFMASNLSLQFGAARLRAGTTAVVMVSEVLFASVSAVALGAATLQPRTVVGGVMIAAAALLAAWHEGRRAAG